MAAILSIAIFVGGVIVFFITLLTLAQISQMLFALVRRKYPTFDAYTVAVIFWTVVLAPHLGKPMDCYHASLLIGGLPVAIGHCRAAKNPHPRHPECYVVKETCWALKAPFLAFKCLFAIFRRRA